MNVSAAIFVMLCATWLAGGTTLAVLDVIHMIQVWNWRRRRA